MQSMRPPRKLQEESADEDPEQNFEPSAPRSNQNPQEAPKGKKEAPRKPRETPRRSQAALRDPQEISKKPPSNPRGLQKTAQKLNKSEESQVQTPAPETFAARNTTAYLAHMSI